MVKKKPKKLYLNVLNIKKNKSGIFFSVQNIIIIKKIKKKKKTRIIKMNTSMDLEKSK